MNSHNHALTPIGCSTFLGAFRLYGAWKCSDDEVPTGHCRIKSPIFMSSISRCDMTVVYGHERRKRAIGTIMHVKLDFFPYTLGICIQDLRDQQLEVQVQSIHSHVSQDGLSRFEMPSEQQHLGLIR